MATVDMQGHTLHINGNVYRVELRRMSNDLHTVDVMRQKSPGCWEYLRMIDLDDDERTAELCYLMHVDMVNDEEIV